MSKCGCWEFGCVCNAERDLENKSSVWRGVKIFFLTSLFIASIILGILFLALA